jgi:hypothetical protein
MAIKRFETQDGIIIRPDDDIVNQNDQSLLGGTGNSASITLTGKIPYVDDLLVASPGTFTRPNNSPNTVDVIDTGLTIKRSNNNGAIYNSAGGETNWNSSVSPLGTEWNADGWGDLADVKTRKYTTFNEACDYNVGEVVTHKDFVMHDTINDKYYTFKFTWWQPGSNYGQNYGGAYTNVGGFSYVRQLINTDPTVYFVRPIDSESTVDDIDTGLSIKRDSAGGGIYNSQEDIEWDADVTPSGTLWNDDGWDDFTDLTTRTWKPLYGAVHGRLGNHLVDRKLMMHDTINDKYYIIMFTDWGQAGGGSFAYWRREVSSTGNGIGITFADGTKQTTAYNPGDIKITDNTITAIHNTSINIETTSDPLINADINIMSSDDIYVRAQGGEGFYAQVDNNFTIEAGDTQFKNYSPGGMYWVASTIVMPNFGGDIGRSLQLYANGTWNLDFRLDTGEWKGVTGTNVNSVGNAIYDAELNNWTIPINIDNTGDPIAITDIRLRDPDYNGSTYWMFNREGCLLPSSKTTASHVAFQGQSNPTLQLGQRGENVTITQAPTNENSRGNNAIRIQGQRGYGTYSTSGDGGYGGNIQIYGGLGGETGDRSIASGGEGGYVEIFGGDGQHGRSGGYLFLQAGDARMSDGSQNYVHGGDVTINAGSATDSLGTGLGTGGSVNIFAGSGNATDQHGRVQIMTNSGNWQFTQTGEFKNNNTYTKTLETDLQGQSVTQVVWTSTQNWISGAKLLIQLETEEIGDTTGWHSQVCEAVIASRGYANGNNGVGEPVMTVYGVTHTSSVPLVTFTVQRNPTTKKIEVVATRTAAVALSSTANLRVYSVETSTRD